MTYCMLDELAYLLGLICGRGTLDYDNKILTIEFLFKSVFSRGVLSNYNQRDKMIVSLDGIVNRIEDFTGKRVRKVNNDSSVSLTINFESNTNTWLEITNFFMKHDSYKSFTLPNHFFRASLKEKKSFIQGFADIAGFIRKSNADQRKRNRVYFEIPFDNWKLPIQLCEIMQNSDVNVPVQGILWGHPNTRGKGNWAKEHQLRIYADKFIDIGFTLDYKRQLLYEYTNENIKMLGDLESKYCNHNKGKQKEQLSRPVDENDIRIPKVIRGRHFDSARHICKALGCSRCI